VIRVISKDDVAVIIAVALCAVFVGLFFVQVETHYYDGVIVAKYNNTTFTPICVYAGKTVVCYPSYSTYYYIIVDIGGKTVKIEVDKSEYDNLTVGDVVKVKCVKNTFGGDLYVLER